VPWGTALIAAHARRGGAIVFGYVYGVSHPPARDNWRALPPHHIQAG
jgi:hypothetical protein